MPKQMEVSGLFRVVNLMVLEDIFFVTPVFPRGLAERTKR